MIDRGVCYHEAGHAVVARALGLSVEEVSANEAGDTWGHMSGLPGEREQVARAALSGTDPELVHRWLLTLAAGPVAKCNWSNGMVRSNPFPWQLWGGSGDERGAKRLLEAARGLNVDLDDVVDEAVDLLKEQDVWAAVQRVVRELRHFDGELDYELFTGALMGYAPLELEDEDPDAARQVQPPRSWPRVISREEAYRQIAARNPFAAARLRDTWERAGVERR